jgi:uncharacterized protein
MSNAVSYLKRSWLANIFLSPSESRLRAGWRLMLQTIMFLIFGIMIGLPVAIATNAVPGNTSGTAFLAFNIMVELVAVTASVFLARRFLDKRSFVSLGFKADGFVIYDILAGVVVTLVMMGSIYAEMWSLGWLKFEAFAWNADPIPVVFTKVASFLLIFILVGWNEELLSRGYHLQTIASGLNLFWGVIISSVIFGGLHLGNPNATWVSAAGIFFAGLFLAYGYIRTKQLWLSIGMHIGWNFFEGVVFGFPVSGLTIYPLTRIVITGPDIWTGGQFGPEAGLIVLPALVLGVILTYIYTRRRLTP